MVQKGSLCCPLERLRGGKITLRGGKFVTGKKGPKETLNQREREDLFRGGWALGEKKKYVLGKPKHIKPPVIGKKEKRACITSGQATTAVVEKLGGEEGREAKGGPELGDKKKKVSRGEEGVRRPSNKKKETKEPAKKDEKKKKRQFHIRLWTK